MNNVGLSSDALELFVFETIRRRKLRGRINLLIFFFACKDSDDDSGVDDNGYSSKYYNKLIGIYLGFFNI